MRNAKNVILAKLTDAKTSKFEYFTIDFDFTAINDSLYEMAA